MASPTEHTTVKSPFTETFENLQTQLDSLVTDERNAKDVTDATSCAGGYSWDSELSFVDHASYREIAGRFIGVDMLGIINKIAESNATTRERTLGGLVASQHVHRLRLQGLTAEHLQRKSQHFPDQLSDLESNANRLEKAVNGQPVLQLTNSGDGAAVTFLSDASVSYQPGRVSEPNEGNGKRTLIEAPRIQFNSSESTIVTHANATEPNGSRRPIKEEDWQYQHDKPGSPIEAVTHIDAFMKATNNFCEEFPYTARKRGIIVVGTNAINRYTNEVVVDSPQGLAIELALHGPLP